MNDSRPPTNYRRRVILSSPPRRQSANHDFFSKPNNAAAAANGRSEPDLPPPSSSPHHDDAQTTPRRRFRAFSALSRREFSATFIKPLTKSTSSSDQTSNAKAEFATTCSPSLPDRGGSNNADDGIATPAASAAASRYSKKGRSQSALLKLSAGTSGTMYGPHSANGVSTPGKVVKVSTPAKVVNRGFRSPVAAPPQTQAPQTQHLQSQPLQTQSPSMQRRQMQPLQAQSPSMQRIQTHPPQTRPFQPQPLKTPFPSMQPSQIQYPQTQPTITPSPKMQPTITPSPKMQPTIMPSPKMQPTITLSPKMQTTIMPSPQTQPTITPSPQTQPTITPSPQTQPTITPSPQTQSTITLSPQTQPSITPSPQTQRTITPSPKTQPTITPSPQTQPPRASSPQRLPSALDPPPSFPSSPLVTPQRLPTQRPPPRSEQTWDTVTSSHNANIAHYLVYALKIMALVIAIGIVIIARFGIFLGKQGSLIWSIVSRTSAYGAVQCVTTYTDIQLRWSDRLRRALMAGIRFEMRTLKQPCNLSPRLRRPSGSNTTAQAPILNSCPQPLIRSRFAEGIEKPGINPEKPKTRESTFVSPPGDSSRLSKSRSHTVHAR